MTDDVGLEDDVSSLGDLGESLARSLVLRIRDLVPLAATYQCLKSNLPISPNTVQVVVLDTGCDCSPGRQYAPVGARAGFALNVVHDGEWWTVAGLEPDWYVPQWLADLTPTETKERYEQDRDPDHR